MRSFVFAVMALAIAGTGAKVIPNAYAGDGAAAAAGASQAQQGASSRGRQAASSQGQHYVWREGYDHGGKWRGHWVLAN